ncbi:MAG: nuclear transport factor 2 family protein [Gemmatimonadetes bacterium]|nr:nuclear transport factor 2 family protein [Gemmatimonadota bacterium]
MTRLLERLPLTAACTAALALLPACSAQKQDAEPTSAGSPVQAVDGAFRADLFAARERIWRGWFANDTVVLAAMLPADFVGIGFGGGPFDTRETAMKGAADFAAAGGKLVSLAFADDRIQRIGDVTTLFSNYTMVFTVGKDSTTQAGRATEVFTKRGGRWINPAWHLDSGK